MSTIRRSRISSPSITVNEGDVTIVNPAKGVVMEDNVGDSNRLKIVDDGGVKTIEVETI